MKTTQSPPTKLKDVKDFSSQHTDSMPALLAHFNASLLITTYQSGRLVIARAVDSTQVNTHFTLLNKPMGLACSGDNFSLGVKNEIIHFENAEAACEKIDARTQEPRPHTACFTPRLRDITGDIDIHEMAYDNEGKLWFINTKFSCLCVESINHSFEPVWKPSFITHLSPEDRCHLNGLAMRDGKPKYVSALGRTNKARGWRDNKRDGGVIIDIDTQQVIAENLSMPHSPRWYQDNLWCLESGHGSLITINPDTGHKHTVCTLPGFTRGLCFLGNIALVGLSQIRESITFGDLPITESENERYCGVWAVDIEQEKVIGFLRFGGDVEEIFAVEPLIGHSYPTVMDLHDPLINTSYSLSNEAIKNVDLSGLHQMPTQPSKQSS